MFVCFYWLSCTFPLSVSHTHAGIAVGHVYYFLEDILPYQAGGFRCLKTPELFKLLLDDPPEDPNYHPLPDDERPGGFNWGGGEGPDDQGDQGERPRQ